MKASIAILEVQVLLVPAAWAIHWFYGEPFDSAYVNAALYSWAFLAFSIISLKWYDRARAGVTLLYLGPLPGRIWFIVAAIGFGWASIGCGFPRVFPNLQVAGFPISDFGLSLMIFNGILAASDCRLTEGGVWYFTHLVPWQRIESCECEGKDCWRFWWEPPWVLRPFVASNIQIRVPAQCADAFHQQVHNRMHKGES